MSLQNNIPHNNFTQKSFTDLTLAAEFLMRRLPPQLIPLLDFSTLEIISGNFVDDEHRSHQSDILYKIKTKNGDPLILYILFEHKSGPDKWAIVQLLRYMLAKWEQDIDNGAKKLTPILPVLFYHGENKWPYPTNLGDYFYQNEAWNRYIPGFEMILQDYSASAGTVIEGSRQLQAVLMALQAIKAKNFDLFFEQLARFLMENIPIDEPGGLKLVTQIVYYYTEGTEKLTLDQLRTVFEQFGREGENIVQTIAVQLREEGHKKGHREGERAGIEKGERIGIEKERERMILKLLNAGKVTHAEIAAMVDLPLAEIERIDEARKRE